MERKLRYDVFPFNSIHDFSFFVSCSNRLILFYISRMILCHLSKCQCKWKISSFLLVRANIGAPAFDSVVVVDLAEDSVLILVSPFSEPVSGRRSVERKKLGAVRWSQLLQVISFLHLITLRLCKRFFFLFFFPELFSSIFLPQLL